MRVSFLEIYNEDLFDLLGSSLDSQKLRIFEDSARKVSVFKLKTGSTITRYLLEYWLLFGHAFILYTAKKKKHTLSYIDSTASSSLGPRECYDKALNCFS